MSKGGEMCLVYGHICEAESLCICLTAWICLHMCLCVHVCVYTLICLHVHLEEATELQVP